MCVCNLFAHTQGRDSLVFLVGQVFLVVLSDLAIQLVLENLVGLFVPEDPSLPWLLVHQDNREIQLLPNSQMCKRGGLIS